MHLKYARYLLRHKWFVFLACLRLKVPLWQAIVHDLSKFRPDEWMPYARYFYGECPPVLRGKHVQHYKDAVAHDFNVAWNHHQKRNPHHWQYWLLINDNPGEVPNYSITSQDGGMLYFELTEYQHGWRENGAAHPVSVVLADMDEGHDPGNKKYQMLLRLTESANKRHPIALPMPDRYIREMIADWIGAGQALGKPDTYGWYRANRKNIVLHQDTRLTVEVMLERLFPEAARAERMPRAFPKASR